MVLADTTMMYRPKYISTRSRFQMMVRPWAATLDGERVQENWIWADERRGAICVIPRVPFDETWEVYWDDPETGKRCGDFIRTVVLGDVKIEGIPVRDVFRRIWKSVGRRAANRIWFWWRRGRWGVWRWWGRTSNRVAATLVPKKRSR
jgi:hypothetical protein